MILVVTAVEIDHLCRSHGFGSRLEGFGVSVSNSPDFCTDCVTWCQHGLSAPPERGLDREAFVDVRCALTARYVFVSLPRPEAFALAEVEVFGASYAPTIDPSKKAEACARACLALDFRQGFSVMDNDGSWPAAEGGLLTVGPLCRESNWWLSSTSYITILFVCWFSRSGHESCLTLRIRLRRLRKKVVRMYEDVPRLVDEVLEALMAAVEPVSLSVLTCWYTSDTTS